MTRNEIFDMACEFYTYGGVSEREIAFARFVVAKEREACADLVFRMIRNDEHEKHPVWVALHQAQAAIRARGEAK